MSKEFKPDWVSPPGDTIFDILEEKQWLESDLARCLNCSTQEVNLLVNGQLVIDEKIAGNLVKCLGGSTEFWLCREAIYRAKVDKTKERK